MAVAFDAKSTVVTIGTTSASWTHTPIGTPTAVGVACYSYNNGTSAAFTATYGGTSATAAFTQVVSTTPDDGVIFGLANPSSGAQTVSVAATGNPMYGIFVAMTVTGSDTTTCFDVGAGATATNSSPSVTISGGTVNDIVFYAAGNDSGGPTFTDTTSGGTSLYANQNTGGIHASAGYTVGATTVTASYTASASCIWIMMAASFKAPGAPPPPVAVAVFSTANATNWRQTRIRGY